MTTSNMAAPLIKFGIWHQKTFPIICRHSSTYKKFWTAVPHMPKDTPKTNELLRTDAYPDVSKLTQMKVFTGSAKVTLNHDIQLTKHIKKLTDEHAEGVHHKFNEVYDRYEELMAPLNYMLNNMYSLSLCGGQVGRTMETMMPTVFERVASARDMVTMRDWFNVVQRLKDEDCANEAQRLVLYKLILEGKELGLDLDGEDFNRLQGLDKELITEELEFTNNIELCFRHHTTKAVPITAVSKLPVWLASVISMNKIEPMRGPFSVSLEDEIYGPFMQYCEDRKFRENIWKNKHDVCSMNMHSEQISNHQRIDELLDLRHQKANLYGYDNYSDYVLENNTMAGSVDAVYGMLTSLKGVYIEQSEEELAQLQEFAATLGFTDKIKPWDVLYYGNLRRSHYYKVDGADVIEYYQYEDVRDKTLTLFSKLLSIKFEDCTRDVEVWDENVKFYRVTDAETQEELGAFYLDPFPRERRVDGYFMREGRERCDQLGLLPYSYLFLNVARVHESMPALLSFDDIDALFRTLGRTLHQVMNKSPYLVTSLTHLEEKDTARIIPTFFSLIARNKHVLRWLSCHYSTGDQLSHNIVDTSLRGENHMHATNVVNRLYRTSLDLQLHQSTDGWTEQVESVYNEFMPFKMEKDDAEPCSMSRIFGYGSKPCLLYTEHWSEMVAADLYQKFNEIGFENIDGMAELGKRLKDIYFYQNGTLRGKDKFRQFMGRDPSATTFIELNKKYMPAGQSEQPNDAS